MNGNDAGWKRELALRPGETVTVRSEREILDTLDSTGRLEGVPFMPEMLRFCGQSARVYRRADKTCDNNWSPGLRRMHRAVFLWGARCDGAAHGGCDAGCLLFWKEAWLERGTDPRATAAGAGSATVPSAEAGGFSRDDLERATTARPGNGADTGSDGGIVYVCQATEIKRAATPLPAWDLRQYVRDVRTGNASVRQVAIGLPRQFLASARELAASRIPRRSHARKTTAPSVNLGLQPGDQVRVKSRREIAKTLDRASRNRGLSFTPEMARYCGGEFRVLRRVERIINEPTGKLVELNDCVILDDVICLGDYHQFCPRAVYPYWREAWLTKRE